ncbi:conserved hypothetical protein [Ricinus communis]|uniref:CCHC-type domain-containing protein n=1 Tax=Ricinus communis TaxID=3988 RepID=B9SBC1_RICCO|nr:conserved hypothetical protein [Ricinus communis]
MAALAKKMKRFFRKERRRSRRPYKKPPSPKRDFAKKGSSDLVSYECKKPGHMKLNCPVYNKKTKKKGKTALATWTGSKGSTSDENEKSDRTK